MTLVIAIDGPSGSGKSTVSKGIADKLSLDYLDTGAMYRSATWWCLHNNIDLSDETRVIEAVQSMPLDMPLDPNNQTIICDNHDITTEIRSSELTKQVSTLSSLMPVRDELIKRQKDIINASKKGIILEGRDTTTVVAPKAPVRILLTASEEERLKRRSLETRGSDDAATLQATRQEVIERDKKDSYVNNFITASDGVHTIDSSSMSIDDVLDTILQLVKNQKKD
ncbi:MAG: (d)CMP kinase [Actinomycetaceae bacterium]|nr:(d)CMP kinase [Actinomycetaceae bacterium]